MINASSVILPKVAPVISPKWKIHDDAIDAGDLDKIREAMGQKITIEGIVKDVTWTTRHDGCNVNMNSNGNESLLIWIAPKVFQNALQWPLNPHDNELRGRPIRVKGIIGLYAGKSPQWTGRLQMILESAKDFTSLDQTNLP